MSAKDTSEPPSECSGRVYRLQVRLWIWIPYSQVLGAVFFWHDDKVGEKRERCYDIDDSPDDLGAEQFVRERSECVEMMRRLCWMAATLYMYSTA